jgi:hypothetical protein
MNFALHSQTTYICTETGHEYKLYGLYDGLRDAEHGKMLNHKCKPFRKFNMEE